MRSWGRAQGAAGESGVFQVEAPAQVRLEGHVEGRPMVMVGGRCDTMVCPLSVNRHRIVSCVWGAWAVHMARGQGIKVNQPM